MEDKILVINRIGTLRRLTVLVLKSLGFSDVLEATSAAHAKTLIEESFGISLIIYEFSVAGPGPDDLEFLACLKRLKTEIKMNVFITAPYAEKPLVLECMKLGVDQFIIKPLEMETLSLRMENALINTDMLAGVPVTA